MYTNLNANHILLFFVEESRTAKPNVSISILIYFYVDDHPKHPAQKNLGFLLR